MMKGEAARKKHSSVRAQHGAHSMVGSAKSPELCRHRDASARARDRLPCLQEHHGQYSSEEELANEKGGSGSGFKRFSFSLFPREALISPAQLPRCLALPQKCLAKRLSCLQHHLHNFPLSSPERGGGSAVSWSCHGKEQASSRKSRVAHCSLPMASLGQTRGCHALRLWGSHTPPSPGTSPAAGLSPPSTLS